jgi:putative restriction endonuclease
LLWYVQYGQALHNTDQDATGVQELVDATNEDESRFIDESQDESQIIRRYDLVELMRAYRDAKFRPAVLRAYRYQCAVCQTALKLVDAAHIVPVSYPQSTDEVTNGLALCRLHHGAYDNALLGICSDFSIVVNHEREATLTAFNLHMGLEAFKAALPQRITVPTQAEVRPAPENLRLGLVARRFPATLVS